MPVIEISVSLDVTARPCSPDVRAFLDFHPQEDLNSEVELRLWPTEDHEWRAMFSVDEPCERFAYRIGIAAHPDAGWRMRIRNCNLDADLLVDSDRLMVSKSWLIGECGIRPRCAPAAPPRRGSEPSTSRRVRLAIASGARVLTMLRDRKKTHGA